MRYAIVGFGRMGQEIDRLARSRGHERVGLVDPGEGGENEEELDPGSFDGAEVAFEFSVPDAAQRNVLSLVRAGVPVVCGTTGWKQSPELDSAIRSGSSGIVISPNFSIGMNLFARSVESTARLLASLELYEPYVAETHHRGKLDVPSGTARRLASILLSADERLETVLEGHAEGRLAPGVLQVVGLRAGSEPGTHRVGFEGEHDSITLEHRARSRAGFALGAVLAAEWLGEREGLFSFDQVLDDMLAHGVSVGDRSR